MECRSTDSGITSSPFTGMEGQAITVSPEGLNIVVFVGESTRNLDSSSTAFITLHVYSSWFGLGVFSFSCHKGSPLLIPCYFIFQHSFADV